MKKEIIIIVAFAAVAVAMYFGMANRNTPATKGLESPTFFTSAQNKAVLCGNASSTLLAAASPSREYLRVSNITGYPMYLTLGATTTNGNQVGIFLAASTTFEMIPAGVVYTGNIYCQATGATATATVEMLP